MKIHFLQAARAIAAWLVILDHTLLEFTDNNSENPLTQIAWALGSAGVYVFFVISGFIMVHICWDSFGRRSAGTNFLQRRFMRIVPLYWLATMAAVLYHRISATHGAHATWWDLASSFAFIPTAGTDGSWTPILPQGWTLNYEMMFYIIFGLSLSLPRKFGMAAVALVLGTFVVLGPFIPNANLAYLASPIVLWFLLGMGLAVVWRWWNINEPTWLAKSAQFLEPLGDASYATYLVHGFVLTMLFRGWVIIMGMPSLWIVPISLVVATFVGWAVHKLVEIPLGTLTASAGRRNNQESRHHAPAPQTEGLPSGSSPTI